MNRVRAWAGRRFPPFVLFLCIPMSQASEGVESRGVENRDGEKQLLESVQVTATRTKALIRDVSAAVVSVDRMRVRAEGPDVLAEVLRGLPGVFYQQTTPGQGIPIIRGLKGSQILHLVDGMRVNNAFFRDAPNQYLGLVDAFATDRVEVVRGAAGSLYGADAMGGVINILTPEISFEGIHPQVQNRLYSSWNSADNALVFRAETQAENSAHGFTGGVTWQDHSDRETGSGTTIKPSAYRSQAADLKWQTRLGSGAQLMISAQVLEQPSTPRTDELVPGFGQDHPASAQFLFQPNRRSFIHARYRSHGEQTWFQRFQVNIARQVITDDRLTQDFGVPLLIREKNESKLDGLTLQFDTAVAPGSTLIWGLEFYADTVSSARNESNPDTGANTQVRSRFPDHSTMDSTALFVSGEWRPTTRLKLGSGLRYSRFRIDLPALEDDPPLALNPEDFTGDLRFVYELSPTQNLVGNLGRGFRPPNIFDLGTLGNRPGNRFNIANPGLKPEQVWSYDLGLKSHTDRWQSELFAFYMDYSDRITSVATGDRTPAGRTVVRAENRNRVTLYGIEAAFRWTATGGTEFYGVLNYTRGEEQDGGDVFPADRIPPMNGKLGAVFHPRVRLRLEPYLMFALEQDRLSDRDLRDPRINPEGTPGWISLNLLLGWTASEHVELGLRLENLSDKDYREHGSGIDAPGINLGAWAQISF